jgi:UDP-N-acetylmuramate--alanine ligase
MDALTDAFVAFANKVPFYGVDVVCLDDARIRAILPRLERRVLTYGMGDDADLSARNVTAEGLGQRFRVTSGGLRLGEIELRMPGTHNVLNALAAVAVGLELEVPFAKIRDGLARFEGVSRRFEVKGEGRGVTVLDDYGHHPTEMTQVFRTAKKVFPGRLFAIFQPHRYSRTAALAAEFGACLVLPDRVFVLPIYAAGERPIAGVASEAIVEAALARGQKAAALAPDPKRLVEEILPLLRAGDVVLTIGAGDVWKLGEEISARLAGGGEA